MFVPFFLRFFPLKINNLWIYKVYERFDEKEYSIVKVIVEEKIPFDDKIIYIFGYYLDNEELKKESYIINNDGLFLYARKLEDNLIVYDPLVSFLPINFDSLSWWSWEGKAGIIPSKIRFENKGFVEEGVFKISYVEENKLGKSNYNLYLKKEVGIVKEESDTPYFSYISELMDHNIDFDDFSMFSFTDFSKSKQDIYEEELEHEEDFQDFEGFKDYEEYEEYQEYENLEDNTVDSFEDNYYSTDFDDETLYIDEDYEEYYKDDYKNDSK
ncbi:MAG: hypothetical protein N2485_06200 [bacterium]|nr:hypothetical protein [bacterium]